MVRPLMPGALKAGAGAPGLATVGPIAVAPPIDSTIPATRAVVTAMAGRSLGMIPSIRSDFAERVEHTRCGKELRQDNGFTLAAIEQIERDAAASEPLQQSGDFRILRRPIAFERNKAAGGKSLAHRLAVESDPLVYQTGDAPGGRQIDKDGLSRNLERRKTFGGERLVGKRALSCRVRHCLTGRRQRRG